MARDPGKLDGRPWSGDVEVAKADAADEDTVRRALDGVDVAYYLVHSLGTGASFERRDRDAAGAFARAAASAGVGRIAYLGGIVSGQVQALSPHLRSRGEVGDILLRQRRADGRAAGGGHRRQRRRPRSRCCAT